MAGRRKKPTQQKNLAGNPGKRASNKAEPKPRVSGVPKSPAYLGRYGKALWNDYAPKLVKLGILSEIDTRAWEALCHAYDRMREAGTDVKKHGRVYTKDDVVRMRPEVRIEAEARKEFRQYCAEFGLTPASRSRVAASLWEQPVLPMNMPNQIDPSKTMPKGPWSSDEEFFGPQGQTKH